jgi:dipeptidyl aminopeptidase/acylaminoacyl peptidase
MKDAEDTTSKKNKPMVINRYQFKQDVEGYRYDTRKTHLYLFTIKDKKLDTLTRGNYNESNARWNPAGTQIAFVSNYTPDPDKNENSDLFIIDAKPGSTEKQLTTWKGYDTNPQWSPDGSKISYHRSTSEDNFIMYDQTILAVLNVKEGTTSLISKSLDRPISFHRWAKDGNSIAVIIADDCVRKLASYNLNTGALTTIQSGNKAFQSIERHPEGHWLASLSDPNTPSELYTLENNSLKKITTANDEFINQIQFASVEKITSKSKDGNIVSNLLFTPPGTTKTNLPSIFFIHGGPVGQDEFSFDITRQVLAAQGYAVVAVNYRGSSGRGLDYCKSIYADWGNKEVLDIQGAANHLINQKIIDSTRMGIGGWSYGGILTDYTIAKDTRFKSAVSGAGSAMQLSLYGVDQYILQFDNELGQPWKDNNYQKYLKLSYPFLNADKIKTPTLFMTGEKDFNVPAVGSEQMYQALKSIGTPTELVIYPGQFHGITVPSFQVDRLNRYIGWFDKYLKVKS